VFLGEEDALVDEAFVRIAGFDAWAAAAAFEEMRGGVHAETAFGVLDLAGGILLGCFVAICAGLTEDWEDLGTEVDFCGGGECGGEEEGGQGEAEHGGGAWGSAGPLA
jgi:hypothetical protein